MSLQVNHVKSILISTPLSQTKKQFRLGQYSFEFDSQNIKMAIQIYRIYLRISQNIFKFYFIIQNENLVTLKYVF